MSTTIPPLDPCPFCGGKPDLTIMQSHGEGGVYRAQYDCITCEAGVCLTVDAIGDTKEEAITEATKLWNTRNLDAAKIVVFGEKKGV